MINNSFYLIDLPGYGFASVSKAARERLEQLVNWYLFNAPYEQKKVVFIVDAYIGMQQNDVEMLRRLEKHGKDIIVVANKIDRIKNMDYKRQLGNILATVGNHPVIPYSAEKKTGVRELLNAMAA